MMSGGDGKASGTGIGLRLTTTFASSCRRRLKDGEVEKREAGAGSRLSFPVHACRGINMPPSAPVRCPTSMSLRQPPHCNPTSALRSRVEQRREGQSLLADEWYQQSRYLFSHQSLPSIFARYWTFPSVHAAPAAPPFPAFLNTSSRRVSPPNAFKYLRNSSPNFCLQFFFIHVRSCRMPSMILGENTM